jgi:hypothetical protein
VRCFSSHLGAGGNQLLLSGEGELLDYMRIAFFAAGFSAAVVSNCLICVAHSSCCFSALQVACGTYVIGAFGHE